MDNIFLIKMQINVLISVRFHIEDGRLKYAFRRNVAMKG